MKIRASLKLNCLRYSNLYLTDLIDIFTFDTENCLIEVKTFVYINY